MNFSLLVCVAMGVFTTYIGLTMLLTQSSRRFVPEPKPDFMVRTAVTVDPASGEKTIYREITVKTRLADPAPPDPATPADSVSLP